MSILIKHFSFVAFLPPFGTLFFYFHSIKTTLAERGEKKGQGCNVMVQNFQCLKKRNSTDFSNFKFVFLVILAQNVHSPECVRQQSDDGQSFS